MLNILYKISNKITFSLFVVALNVFFNIVKKNFFKYPQYVLDFENHIAKYFKLKHALTFSSGTMAGFTSISSLGLGENSCALVSKLTFPSSIVSLLLNNIRPIYLDFDKDLNPIVDNLVLDKKPELALLTNAYGFPIDKKVYDKIRIINPSIKIISDCSHSQGAKINEEYVNKLADISFMSLQGDKAISGGEGGVCCTNSDELYNKMILLSHPGRKNKNPVTLSIYVGLGIINKGRMHPLAAPIALASLRNLNRNNFNIKKKIKIIYNILDNLEFIQLPKLSLDKELGGFHYGIPFFLEKKNLNIENNRFVPVKKYNWPPYEKLNFYNFKKNYLNELDSIKYQNFLAINGVKEFGLMKGVLKKILT